MFTAIISGYRFLYLQLAALIGYGWAIVALSFICSALMLPLMRAVAGIVRREKEYEDVIDPQVAAIKAKYESDMDRHFHIQALYQRYGYSPLAPIKKVMPLFVQIPFLLLTYYMLKGTAQLSGVSFLFLSDLGQPDTLIFTSTFSVHLLPLVMTGVNILTVFATPGFSHKDWTQAIAISLLFLGLLYTAPSALLLYWTLNNTITFVRTLCEKQFAGLILISSRLNPLLYFKWMASRPKDFWAYVILVLFIMTCYFSFTSSVMLEVNGGYNRLIMFRLMPFTMALSSVVSFMFLFREKSVNRVVLILSVVVCVSYATIRVVALVAPIISLEKLKEVCFVNWYMLVMVVSFLLPYFLSESLRCEVPRALVAVARVLSANAYLLILPVIFSVHYSFSSDVFILPFSSLFLLSLYMVLPPVGLWLILSICFRRWLDADRLFKIAIGLFVGIYIIPMITTGVGFFGYSKNLPVRLLVLTLFPIVLLKIRRRTMVVFLVILFVAVIINAFANHGIGDSIVTVDDSSARGRLRATIGEAQCVKSNNVYLIVYDSYAHQTVMEGLHLQSNETMDLLRKNGFTVYSAYSKGCDTITSMSQMFEIAGVSGGSRKSTIAGDNVFSDFLRVAGYTTSYLLCGYIMPNRGERMPGDYYFPRAANITRPELVLYPCIFRGTFSQSPQVFNNYSHEEWLSEFHRVVAGFSRSSGNFVYAHSSLPGHANWSPRERKSDAEEQADYRNRLKMANREILENIALALNDPEAIVIFASDHGASMLIPEPYGNWDARHLSDHFGVLLAIRWPKDYKPCLHINCLQNVLLEVMIYLSGDYSLARLEDDGVVMPMQKPIGTPRGVVSNGVIRVGQDACKELFSAAKDEFRLHENEEM